MSFLATPNQTMPNQVMPDNRPIGIFDSGVGGLSIARCIHQQLPHENFIYVADSKFAPYGEKSAEVITERVNEIAEQLIAKDVKAIVVACNTATVNAVELLRARINLPIIGVEPAIKPAALNSKSKKIGLWVTQATAESARFNHLINTHKKDTQVFIQACPGLVELVEQNKIESAQCQQLIAAYLAPLIAQQIDHLVLGCTHYPFLLAEIKKQLPEHIKIVETSLPVTAQLLRRLTTAQIENCQSNIANYRFLSSCANEEQNKLFSHLWQKAIILEKLLF